MKEQSCLALKSQAESSHNDCPLSSSCIVSALPKHFAMS